jgi:ubiquinone biosynthesis protein
VTARALTGLVRRTPRAIGILRVLARRRVLNALRGRAHWPAPADLRVMFEELGVVFIKFGQVLAVRRDIMPDAYAEELEQLHDRLPPVPFTEIAATVERELGGPLGDHFASFDEVPLGSASIAQVHKAELPDGRAVVVKVRRTGLAARIAEDTAILADLAALVDEHASRLRASDPVGMVQEFRQGLTREMDFRLEAQTIRRFRKASAGVGTVWIPDVVPELSGATVLVMEHSPGTRIDEYARRFPDRRPALARAVAELLLHQVFESGLFHADPHPGNLFVLPDGRLCLHDFGAIGELDQTTRDGLASLLDAVVRADARAAADAYLDLGLVGADVDRAAFEADLGTLLRRIHERPLAEVSVGEALQSLLRVGARHQIRNPGAVLLLARAFLIAEAVMSDLDPELNVVAVFGDELKRLAVSRYAPSRVASAGRRLGHDIERFLDQAPSDLRRSLRRLADGELGRVRAPGVEEAGRRMTRGVERATGAIASAAFLIAGSLLVVAGGWHRPLGDALLFTGILGSMTVALGAFRGH